MVTENKEPEKPINKLIGYRKVPNRIRDRMIDNSLAHNFIVPDDEKLKKKVLVKTKIFNRLLRLNNYSYNRYVQLKKKMIEFLADVENIESLDNIDHIFDKFVFPIDDEEPIKAVRDISDSFDDSDDDDDNNNNDSESADSEAAGAEFKLESVDVDHQSDKYLISGQNLSDDIDIEDDKSLLLAHSQEKVDESLLQGHNQNEDDDIDIEDDKSLFLVHGRDKVDDVNDQCDEFLGAEQDQAIVSSQDDKSLVLENNLDDQVDESSRPGHKVDDQVGESSGPGYSQDIFDESLGSGHGDDQVDESLRSGHKIDDQVDKSLGPGHSQHKIDQSSKSGHKVEVHDDESSLSGHGDDQIDDQVDKSSRPSHKIGVHDDKSSLSGHSHDKVDESSGLGHKIDDQGNESSRPGYKIGVHDDESSLSGDSYDKIDESLGQSHKIDDQADKSSRLGHKVDDQVNDTSEPGYSQDIFDESFGSGHSDDKVDESSRPDHKIEVHDDESSLSDHSQLIIDDQVDESSGANHKVEVHDDESSLSGHSDDQIDDQVNKSSGPGHSKHKIYESSRPGHKTEVHDDESSRPGHKIEVDDDESSLSDHSDDKIDDQVEESSRPGHKVKDHHDKSSLLGHSQDNLDNIDKNDFIEENSIDLDIVKHSPLISEDQDHEKQSLSAKSDGEDGVNDQDRISEINQDLIEESSLDSNGRLEIISKSGSEADFTSLNYNSPIKTQARVNGNDLIEDHPSDKSELQDLDDNFIEEHFSESDGEKLCISRSESEHDANSQDGKNNKVMIKDDDSDSDSPRLFLSRSESEVESNDGRSGKLETEDDVDFVGEQSLIQSKELSLNTVQKTGDEEDEEDDGKSITSQSKQEDYDNDNEGDDDSNKELALSVFNDNDNGNHEDDYDDIIDKSVILSFPDLDKDDNKSEQDVDVQDNFETTDHLIKSELEINNEKIQASYKSPTSDEDDDSQKNFANLQNITWSPLKLNQEIETDDNSISKSSSSIIDENLVKKIPEKNKIHSEPGAKVINDNSRSPVIDHDNSSQSSQGRSKCQLKITSNQVVVSKYTIIKDKPKPQLKSPAASRNSSDDDDEEQVVKKSKLARAVSPERRPKKQASQKKEQDDEYDSEEELIKYMNRKRSMVKTKKKFGGKSLTSPTIEDSLKFVRKKILPFSDYYQSTENEQGNASMVDDYDSSECSESDYVFDKEAEASYIHYNDIDQYAESKNLQDLYLETTFTYEDLSEDDEIFMMEFPKSIIEKGNLEGQQMKLKKKYLEIGDTRYNISKVEDDEINLVLKDNHYDDSYRIENIQPIKSIIIHEPKSPVPDEEIIDDSKEPKISFPKNLKTRNPLELNKQPIKATSKRKIDLENNSLKTKKLKLIN
ncbi:protein PFC0760c-like [Cotesia glomerata]|uniref:protein PFC0760c-like n=1 Tax=Cotesia glomerata TaxID=32391 RepID=UPI001D01E5D0|nr:protein PFC0760c-like [Cotesia glomerata]